jgi:phosphonate transport system substrate-binding protein
MTPRFKGNDHFLTGGNFFIMQRAKWEKRISFHLGKSFMRNPSPTNLPLIFLPLIFFLFVMFPQADSPHAEEPLTIGIHPYLAPNQLQERFRPLADYLSSQLNRPVRINVCRNYEEHIIETGDNTFEISYMGPASYVKMVDLYGRKPIIGVLEINGRPTFRGVIFTLEKSHLRTLSDLKGHRFAFGDPNSTMSHLVPRYMLMKAGVDVTDLSAHDFLSNHNNVALGVLIGDFDAGAVKEEVFYRYKDRGLRELARTPEIAEHLFIASSKLPPETIEALRRAFRDLKNIRKIMWSIKKNMTGIVQADDSDYDNLRTILSGLGQSGIQK